MRAVKEAFTAEIAEGAEKTLGLLGVSELGG